MREHLDRAWLVKSVRFSIKRLFGGLTEKETRATCMNLVYLFRCFYVRCLTVRLRLVLQLMWQLLLLLMERCNTLIVQRLGFRHFDLAKHVKACCVTWFASLESLSFKHLLLLLQILIDIRSLLYWRWMRGLNLGRTTILVKIKPLHWLSRDTLFCCWGRSNRIIRFLNSKLLLQSCNRASFNFDILILRPLL